MNPLVSIVIPVYNGSNYMREAIDSALSQTYSNIEVIVVNDGSTDNTREIALSYGDKIRYFEKENGGVSTALNLAIREMKGEYFSWLSHDDVYYPNKVEDEIDALKKSGNMEQAVHSGWDLLTMPQRKVSKYMYIHSLKPKYLEIGLLLPILGIVSGCALLIPKSFFNQYGLFDESLRGVQDYLKWFQMFRDRRLLYVNTSLVQSRIHDKQVTFSYNKMDKEENWLYRFMLESLSDDEILQMGINSYLFWGAALSRMKRGCFQEAYDIALKRLQDSEEPKDGVKRRKEFNDYLNGFSDKGVYLYCAGSRGETLIMDLQFRGIQIAGISDTDSSKWGTTIRGVKCITPAEIPKDALVIVTKFNPQEVIDMLCENGYARVTSYDNLMNWTFETAIDKDNLYML